MKSFLDFNSLSKLFSLNAKDFLKGALIAIFSGIIDALVLQISEGEINYNHLIIVALTSFLSYLNVRFFSNESGDFLKK